MKIFIDIIRIILISIKINWTKTIGHKIERIGLILKKYVTDAGHKSV